MHFTMNISCFLILLVLNYAQSSGNISTTSNTTTKPHKDGNEEDGHEEDGNEGIILFKFDFHHVQTPLIACVWVLVACLAKIAFHYKDWVAVNVPESSMLILLGIPIGVFFRAIGVTHDEIYLSSELFFFFLLPPIIFDAGYFVPAQLFFLNIGTILIYAVFGTLFNAFAIGISLYACDSTTGVGLSLLYALLFGSLISAVDPVAVLAIFEEVHVNEVLYMLVFGESVLNDAASVVLYRTFESLIKGTVNAKQITFAFLSFFIVSIGGTIIGVVFALLTSVITRCTEHVRVIEPAVVFLMAYLAYLFAEMFHFSGIMSIFFCAVVMKPYVESNISRKSHTTIKYFLKLISSSCESIIFMFLGISLVNSVHNFNVTFVVLTLMFISVYRAVGVIVLTGLANKCGRLTKVKKVDQFIMSYGGLRGAVAFCLAVLLAPDDKNPKLRDTIVTTTMCVVIFTIFIQGFTIKKLVELLHVKQGTQTEKTMTEIFNDRVLGYIVAGIEEIMGIRGHGYMENLYQLCNRRYFRQWLTKDPDLLLDEEMVVAQRRMAYKSALSYAKNSSMKSFALSRYQDSFDRNLVAATSGNNAENSVSSFTVNRGEVSYVAHSEPLRSRSDSANSGIILKERRPSKYSLEALGESDAHDDHMRIKRQRRITRGSITGGSSSRYSSVKTDSSSRYSGIKIDLNPLVEEDEDVFDKNTSDNGDGEVIQLICKDNKECDSIPDVSSQF